MTIEITDMLLLKRAYAVVRRAEERLPHTLNCFTLQKIGAWLRDSTQVNRYQFHQLAYLLHLETAASWLALAIYWVQDSIKVRQQFFIPAMQNALRVSQKVLKKRIGHVQVNSF